LKAVCNAFHALKVAFANEVGSLCNAMSIDGHSLMAQFVKDTKLNISTAYMRPGLPFGGSCLPKDLRALLHVARSHDVPLPILGSVLPSNQLQIERAVQTVIDQGHQKVGVLGISFKAGTDDLRESPMVELAERLIGKGFDLRVYDRSVSLASIHGANRDYILNRIPHLSRLMVQDLEDVIAHAGTIVVGTGAPEFRDVAKRLRDGQTLVDLVRICDARSVSGVYEGICW